MHFGSMSTNFGRTVSLTVHAFYSELSKSKTAKALGEQMVRDESVFEWLSRSTMREDGEERIMAMLALEVLEEVTLRSH